MAAPARAQENCSRGAASAPGPQAKAELRRFQKLVDSLGKGVAIPRGYGEPRIAHHLTQGAAGARDEGRAAGHGLRRGEAEPFVERGHHRKGRLGIALAQHRLGEPCFKGDCVAQPQGLEPRPGGAVGVELADHPERERRMAFPQRGEGLEEHGQPLQGTGPRWPR